MRGHLKRPKGLKGSLSYAVEPCFKADFFYHKKYVRLFLYFKKNSVPISNYSLLRFLFQFFPQQALIILSICMICYLVWIIQINKM